jgi:hypothetical protein
MVAGNLLALIKAKQTQIAKLRAELEQAQGLLRKDRQRHLTCISQARRPPPWSTATQLQNAGAQSNSARGREGPSRGRASSPRDGHRHEDESERA